MRKWLIFLGFAAILGANACSDDGDSLPDLQGYADSPDRAVRLYQAAYRSKNVEQLEKILSPDFVFEMHPDDADSLGTSMVWTFEEELAIGDRIFRGENGVRLDGTCQPPPLPGSEIGLTLDINESPLGEPTQWLPVNEGPYRGSLARELGISGQLLDANGLQDFIEGRHRIYAERARIPVDGRCCLDVWRLVGWDDLGVNSIGKHGYFSWGRVKARWRSDAPDPTDCP